MNKCILFLFGILLFSNKSVSQINQTENQFNIQETKKILTKEVNKILKETGIPSISFSLIKGESIVWSNAFGYTNVKKQIPATTTTIYNTGSNFKFVTATAIMQLAENGKLNIDDPINIYLKDLTQNVFTKDGKSITFRHLLSHHSGLKDVSLESIHVWKRKSPKALKTLLSRLESKHSPGEKFEYNNSCYGLLGFLIERISGVSYQEYIVKNILKPLKVQSESPVTPTPKMVEELALPYKLENNNSIPEYQFKLDFYPAGDIYLTPNEMAHFYIAQLNRGFYKNVSILNPTSIAEIQKKQFGSSYGLGIGVINDKSGKYLQHAGGTPGFSTFFVAEKNSKRGIYIAANASNSHKTLGIIANLALKLLNGDKNIKPLPTLAKKVYKEIELTEELLKKYSGKYQIAPSFFIEITKKGKQLFGQATGQGKFEMFAYEQNKFFLKVVDAKVYFHIRDGKVKGLTFFQNGKTNGIKIK